MECGDSHGRSRQWTEKLKTESPEKSSLCFPGLGRCLILQCPELLFLNFFVCAVKFFHGAFCLLSDSTIIFKGGQENEEKSKSTGG